MTTGGSGRSAMKQATQIIHTEGLAQVIGHWQIITQLEYIIAVDLVGFYTGTSFFGDPVPTILTSGSLTTPYLFHCLSYLHAQINFVPMYSPR